MNLDEYKLMVKGITANPFGIGIAQNWAQIGSIFEDLNRFKITLFVELGVFLGGFSDLMLLRMNFVPGFDYLGTQLDYEQVAKRLSGNPRIIQGNHWDEPIVSRIQNLINTNVGTAMVYCDGGDKPREIRTYTPMLRVGDYIRAHDYPGETTPESLDEYASQFPYMEEIEKEKCRELGYTLWKRIS